MASSVKANDPVYHGVSMVMAAIDAFATLLALLFFGRQLDREQGLVRGAEGPSRTREGVEAMRAVSYYVSAVEALLAESSLYRL